jgi:hypothetical protein
MRIQMFKTLLATAAIMTAVASTASANHPWMNNPTPSRDAQILLKELGYQIRVDGSWGPQSKQVISQFYVDRGQIYDGTLSENEFADLWLAVGQLTPDHPRAKHIDYSITYDFGSEPWSKVDIDAYARDLRDTWGDHSGWNKFYKENCHGPLTDLTGIYENRKPVDKQRDCMIQLNHTILDEILTHGKRSPHLIYAFEELFPLWAKNTAFTARNFYDGNNTQANHQIGLQNAAFELYFNFASYYGVSAELDAMVAEWFEQADKQLGFTVRHPAWGNCVNATFYENPPPRGWGGWSEYPDNPHHYGADCANGSAMYGGSLAYAGLYFKNSDYVNEAIDVVQIMLDAAAPGGQTSDASRGVYAVGYHCTVAIYLVEIAEIVKDVGVDIYAMKGRQSGATPGDIINYCAAISLDTSINYDYQKWQCYLNKTMDCTKEYDRDIGGDNMNKKYSQTFTALYPYYSDKEEYIDLYSQYWSYRDTHYAALSLTLNQYIIHRIEN